MIIFFAAMMRGFFDYFVTPRRHNNLKFLMAVSE